MESRNVQYYAEKIEDILQKECKNSRLTMEEFNNLNFLLLELQCAGLYRVPDKYFVVK